MGDLQRMDRGEALMRSIARQLPIATDVRRDGRVPTLLTKEPHAEGVHSITWFNYPHDKPVSLRIFSHINDPLAIKEGRQKTYSAGSVRELLHLINLLFRSPLEGLEGVDLIKKVLEAGGTTPYSITDLQADVIEYCDAEGLPFEEVLAEANSLFSN
jgi:hypothetical protein